MWKKQPVVYIKTSKEEKRIKKSEKQVDELCSCINKSSMLLNAGYTDKKLYKNFSPEIIEIALLQKKIKKDKKGFYHIVYKK